MSKPTRTVAAAVLSIGLALGATACSTPQTLIPYTPAEGVNIDVKRGTDVPLKVRNLLIMTKQKGQGTLVGAIVSQQPDTLTSVNGRLITVKGEPGGTLGPAQANVEIRANELVNLLDQPAISLNATDLVPGQTADLVLTFKTAGPVTLRVPVIDGTQEDYKTASPKPASASASASATPSATATP
ncbi:hypothetical protein [Mariniluteicoccus flavus]